MTDFDLIRQKIKELKCCIVIATYNNDHTLEGIVREVLEYTSDVIVINDGSTDSTPEILGKLDFIRIINLSRNKGKGYALRLGFHHAVRLGYRYAITLDTDGQHFPSDIPKFIEKIEQFPDSVIVGSRNMLDSSIPGTSLFGHRFSVFWFRIETGLRIPDIQSGYRLYPLEPLERMRFIGRKYEFEVEVLAKLAWKNIEINSIPVRVYYAPRGEQISHFRKFRDFTRVSIANTLLVLTALLWVNPFRFIKALRKKPVRKFIEEYIVNSDDSNLKIALSVTVGVFIGVIPVWGFQMLAAFGVAYLLKLNKFVAVAASNISIPPMLPFILFLSYITGRLIIGYNRPVVAFSAGLNFEWVKANLVQYLVGSVVFGFISGMVLGSLTYLILRIFRKQGLVKDNPSQDPS